MLLASSSRGKVPYARSTISSGINLLNMQSTGTREHRGNGTLLGFGSLKFIAERKKTLELIILSFSCSSSLIRRASWLVTP